jgi:hypothetical protein
MTPAGWRRGCHRNRHCRDGLLPPPIRSHLCTSGSLLRNPLLCQRRSKRLRNLRGPLRRRLGQSASVGRLPFRHPQEAVSEHVCPRVRLRVSRWQRCPDLACGPTSARTHGGDEAGELRAEAEVRALLLRLALRRSWVAGRSREGTAAVPGGDHPPPRRA